MFNDLYLWTFKPLEWTRVISEVDDGEMVKLSISRRRSQLLNETQLLNELLLESKACRLL